MPADTRRVSVVLELLEVALGHLKSSREAQIPEIRDFVSENADPVKDLGRMLGSRGKRAEHRVLRRN